MPYRFAAEMENCRCWGVDVADRRRQRVAGWASRDDGQHWEQLPLAQPELPRAMGQSQRGQKWQ